MSRKWYKVLVVVLVLVTRVRVAEAHEGWPLSEAQGADGDNPRAGSGEDPVDRAIDYTDERLLETESRRDVSKDESQQDISEGEGADDVKEVLNDDDEVEDLAYDSDIEKINSKTGLEDVDTGKHSRHEMAVPVELQGRRSLSRRQQRWDDKAECLVVRQGRDQFTQKELSRDTRELVTRESPIYYDMKRAKRRMLAFPRHGSENRSSWGAKILEALETALNTAAKQIYNTDERESITGQYPDKTTLTDMVPTHTLSTSEFEEPKRNTFLTDHRLPLTNSEQGESIGSTSESPRLERTKTPTQQKKTLLSTDITPTVTNLGQNHDKKVVDPHKKREKSYNTWSRYRDNYDDSSEEEEGRMDVMPYSDETRKNVKPQRGRGKSPSSESEQQPVMAKIIKSKTTKSKLLRTTTSVALQRTKVYATTENEDSLMDNSDSTSQSAEAVDISMDEKSAEKTTRRVKNFYPIRYTTRNFSIDSQSNEDDDKSPYESNEKPSSTPPPSEPLSTITTVVYRTKEKSSETIAESSEEYSLEESKNQQKESDEGSSEDIGIELNHTVQTSSEKTSHIEKESWTQRSKANSLDVSQHPVHHTNSQMNHSSIPKLLVNNSEVEHDQISGRRDNKEFHPSLGKEATKITPGKGLIADPDFPAPVVVSRMEELFILPEASHPMRRHWESFYKSVSSQAPRQKISLQLAIVVFFQNLIEIILKLSKT